MLIQDSTSRALGKDPETAFWGVERVLSNQFETTVEYPKS